MWIDYKRKEKEKRQRERERERERKKRQRESERDRDRESYETKIGDNGKEDKSSDLIEIGNTEKKNGESEREIGDKRQRTEMEKNIEIDKEREN
jgi:hypothetical protein